MIYELNGITIEGRRYTNRIVSLLDPSKIMDNPTDYGYHTLLSVREVDDRLEIVGEEPPKVDRRK